VEGHLAEFLFAQLVLLLASGLLFLVSYFLKRFVTSMDAVKEEVKNLSTSVKVILDRDRRVRIREYAERDRLNSGTE